MPYEWNRRPLVLCVGSGTSYPWCMFIVFYSVLHCCNEVVIAHYISKVIRELVLFVQFSICKHV